MHWELWALSAAVPAALTAAAWGIEQARRGRLGPWLQHEHDRYRLRVRIPGAKGEPASVGHGPDATSVESVEVDLVDDFDRRVHLPAGRRLDLSKLAGAQQRDRTWRVPAGEPFWILDAPPAHRIERDPSTALAPIPAHSSPHILTSEAPPLPTDLRQRVGRAREVAVVGGVALGLAGAPLLGTGQALAFGVLATLGAAWVGWRASVLARTPRLPAGVEIKPGIYTTGMLFTSPIWAGGTDGAAEWLCRSELRGAAPVTVLDMTTPRSPPGVDPEDERAGLIAVELAEAITMHTDVRAAARCEAVRGRARVFSTHTRSWTEVRGTLEDESGLAIWGEVDVRAGEVTLHLRSGVDGSEERVLKATIAEVIPRAIDLLVELGVARRVEPPAWFGNLPEAAREAYESLLDRAILTQMRTSGILTRDQDGDVATLVEDARALAQAHPNLRQLALLWLNLAGQADQTGQLPDAQREAVSVALRDASSPDDPVARLAPLWLERLGWKAEAAVRCRRLAKATQVGGGAYREGPDAYGTWLRRIEERCREPDAA